MSLVVDLRSVVELLVSSIRGVLALVLLVLQGERDNSEEAENKPHTDQASAASTICEIRAHNTSDFS